MVYNSWLLRKLGYFFVDKFLELPPPGAGKDDMNPHRSGAQSARESSESQTKDDTTKGGRKELCPWSLPEPGARDLRGLRKALQKTSH